MPQKQRRQCRSPGREPASARGRVLVVLLLLAVAAAFVAGVVWRLRGAQRADVRSRLPVEAGGAVENTAAAAVTSPDLRKLIGRWRRTGEQYVLEVRAIDTDGKVNAAYFNPGPIRVSRAAAEPKDGAAALFVELRDTGYPGCTYTLVHDPGIDQLVGVYYQAAMGERYEIAFERMR